MNRRSFLSIFGSVATVAAVKPVYFFAPPGGWRPRKIYSFNSGDFILRNLHRDLAEVPKDANLPYDDLSFYYQNYNALMYQITEPMRRLLAEHPEFERLL